jgi:hypothetical protein
MDRRMFRTIAALTCACLSSVVGAEAPVKNAVIATTGTAAPAGGNYRHFAEVALNEEQQVIFVATLVGVSNTGVFRGDGETTSVVALGGNPDSTAMNLGDLINSVSLAGHETIISVEPFDPDKSQAFFRAGRKEVSLIVEDGDATPSGGILSISSDSPDPIANSHGAVAYTANVFGAPETQGIFRTDRTGTVAIADDISEAPTGGTFLFFDDLTLNSHGQASFFAGMGGGSAAFGVFRGDGKSVTTIFASNQSAPGGGTFVDFGTPVMNNHGQVEVFCSIDNGPAASGLFLSDGKNVVTIALEGKPAPKGGNYLGGFRRQFLDDHERVAFLAQLTGSGEGIFRRNHNATVTVALLGGAAPGTNGIFLRFDDYKMDEDGNIAILAALVRGAGGVDNTNDEGIWIGTSEADLHLVVRTGELIAGNTLVKIPGAFDINDRGVAWIGNFAGNSSSVILSSSEERR